MCSHKCTIKLLVSIIALWCLDHLIKIIILFYLSYYNLFFLHWTLHCIDLSNFYIMGPFIMDTNETLLKIHDTIFSAVMLNNTMSDPERKFAVFDVSIDMPPKIASDGLWGDQSYGALPKRSTLPLLEVQIFLIFIITQCFHTVLKRLGFPYFVSQMMVCIYIYIYLLSAFSTLDLLISSLIQQYVTLDVLITLSCYILHPSILNSINRDKTHRL